MSLCEASEVGAIVDLSDLPISENLARALGDSEARRQALNAGDDYELCFAASRGIGPAVSAIAKDVGITRIGRITDCRLEVTIRMASLLLSQIWAINTLTDYGS